MEKEFTCVVISRVSKSSERHDNVGISVRKIPFKTQLELIDIVRTRTAELTYTSSIVASHILS